MAGKIADLESLKTRVVIKLIFLMGCCRYPAIKKKDIEKSISKFIDYLEHDHPVSKEEKEERIEVMEEIIMKWQRSWMDVKGTDEKDRKNYFERSAGIDANMRFDLAKRIVEMKRDTKIG